MNPEEMKEKWNEINSRLENIEAVNSRILEHIKLDKVKSAQERLAQQYKRFCTILPMLGICCTFNASRFMPIGIIIAFIAFFCIAAVTDYYLWQGIKSIDTATMGVAEVAAKARLYRRRHHQAQILLAAIIIPLVTALFIYANDYSRMGIIAGGTIGVAIGLAVYFNMMRSYKTMIAAEADDL